MVRVYVSVGFSINGQIVASQTEAAARLDERVASDQIDSRLVRGRLLDQLAELVQLDIVEQLGLACDGDRCGLRLDGRRSGVASFVAVCVGVVVVLVHLVGSMSTMTLSRELLLAQIRHKVRLDRRESKLTPGNVVLLFRFMCCQLWPRRLLVFAVDDEVDEVLAHDVEVCVLEFGGPRDTRIALGHGKFELDLVHVRLRVEVQQPVGVHVQANDVRLYIRREPCKFLTC